MALNPYIKSLFWSLSIGFTCYALMILTKPSEETVAKIRAKAVDGVHLSEVEKNNLLFMQKLKEAANLKGPIDMKKSDN